MMVYSNFMSSLMRFEYVINRKFIEWKVDFWKLLIGLRSNYPTKKSHVIPISKEKPCMFTTKEYLWSHWLNSLSNLSIGRHSDTRATREQLHQRSIFSKTKIVKKMLIIVNLKIHSFRRCRVENTFSSIQYTSIMEKPFRT